MQYIHVKLLNGFTQPLTYAIPPDWHENLTGTIVQVPLKNKIVSAYVIGQVDALEFKPSFAIKKIHAREPFPADTTYQKFLLQIAAYYQVDHIHCIKRIAQFLNQEAQPLHEQPSPEAHEFTPHVILTPAQSSIVNTIQNQLGAGSFSPSLLHGVTGSGKTQIYKELIIAAIQKGSTAMLLLPEVSLALQFQQILARSLPNTIEIMGFHSAVKAKEKKKAWQALIEKKPILLIGVHIPILLPIANLGLIIIDEEHDVGYQEKKHPKINTKEAALIRAQLAQIPILLGSATPSIATMYIARKKGWQFFQLHERFAGMFPTIKIVSLRMINAQRRQNFWITKELETAIGQCLAKKEQAIIFLNRRGYSFFVQCKQCSFIFECSHCSVSLTLHQDSVLTCHYCGNGQALPPVCPSCKTNSLLKKGIGTQQVVTILQQLFPTARIGRADMDVSSKKKVWQQTMSDFENGTIDILVGTQTITKGFHFPNVTLVGILWADLNLHFPIYNAAETSLQQLIQVAGRAGRTRPDSLVIVQTMMDHPVFKFLSETDYLKYYDYELQNRTAANYPPLTRLVEIELKNTNQELLEQEAADLATTFLHHIQEKNFAITLLGPAKPPVSKIKNIHARKIYLKSNSMADLIKLYQLVKKSTFKSQIFFTPNPN